MAKVLQSMQISYSLAELKDMANQLTKETVVGGITIGLVGGLGAGKSTLVRELLAALGGNLAEFSSPTYTLENIYNLSGELTELLHLDLYRLSAFDPSLFRELEASQVRIVEWADKFAESLEECDIVIYIEKEPRDARTLRIER